MATHKIAMHLWFDNQAAQAGAFYLKAFKNSRLLSTVTIPDTPSGVVETLTLELEDITLMLLSAGPHFKINPSASLLVRCTCQDTVREHWNILSEGGRALMPLAEYSFSPLYGWVEDKFGVSWQIMYTGDDWLGAKVVPALMFSGKNYGRAEEAIGYYTHVFKNSEVKSVSRYGIDSPPNRPGTVIMAEFVLEGSSFAIMENAYEHAFSPNEAVSFVINCDTQAEIDYYWHQLTAVPEAEQCGWLKDKYGISWQVTPTRLQTMLQQADPGTLARVTQAFLKMKKFDLAALERAYAGTSN